MNSKPTSSIRPHRSFEESPTRVRDEEPVDEMVEWYRTVLNAGRRGSPAHGLPHLRRRASPDRDRHTPQANPATPMPKAWITSRSLWQA